MPKSKKASAKTEPIEEMQKLYARAYASRLVKQVGSELESFSQDNDTQKADGRKLTRRLRVFSMDS